MDSKVLFTKTSPIKLFFIAAIPGIVSMLASSLFGLVDGLLVGRILGETAFAALNLAFPFIIINFSLADLIGVGSTVPISISLGRKQEKKANNIFTCAVLMIVGTGGLIGAILFAAAPALIGFMGAEGELADFAVQYLRVYALCSPITTIVFAMDNYLRVCGKIRGSMVLNILMSLIGIVLEITFLLIFRWGIWAAALATCMGMATCALIAIYPYFRGRMQLKFTKPHFSGTMIREIIASGSPAFLNNIAGRITSIIMNFVLLRLGGEYAISVYGVLMYVDGFVQPLLYGMCDSLQPAVGYNWGAGNISRVKAIEKACFSASAIVSVACAIIIFLIPEQLVTLFISNGDAEFVNIAVGAIKLFSFTYITRWFSFAVQSFMTAVNKPLPATYISVSTALVFPAILIALLWPLGLTGIWLNFAGTSLLAAVLSVMILVKFKRELSHE